MKPPPGWKTRLFFLTRDQRWLTFTALAIMTVGYLAACVIVWHGQQAPEPTLRESLEATLGAIETSQGSSSRALARWLHEVLDDPPQLAEVLEESPPNLEVFMETGRLFGLDLNTAIQRHAGPQDQQVLFRDYIAARIVPQDEQGKLAWQRVNAAALRLPPAPLANEFLGHLLHNAAQPAEALDAFRREARFPDATHAREYAIELAIDQNEKQALRDMLADPLYRQDVSPWQETQVGVLLNDLAMQLRGIIRAQWHAMDWHVSVIALLAAGLWYSVLVRSGPREPLRWLRPVPALLLGIISVWPVLLFLHNQESVLGMTGESDFPNDLLYYVFGVGLREELAKLALFSLLLPSLLRKGSAAAALLSGAFVGLGFALEENPGYYQTQGFGAAIVRLLTANFMHAGWTSLAGFALYEMVRTRFAKTDYFLTTLTGVIVTHGVYDWAITAGGNTPMLGDISLVSIFVLALLAQQFFSMLGQWVQPSRSVISLLSIFVIGTSVLIALSFMIEASATQDMAAVHFVGASALGLAPIAIFYIRRFREM